MQIDVRRARIARASLAAPAATLLAALALSGPAAAAPTTSVSATSYVPHQGPGAMTQGIIMRDGGICDPIRHMGC